MIIINGILRYLHHVQTKPYTIIYDKALGDNLTNILNIFSVWLKKITDNDYCQKHRFKRKIKLLDICHFMEHAYNDF